MKYIYLVFTCMFFMNGMYGMHKKGQQPAANQVQNDAPRYQETVVFTTEESDDCDVECVGCISTLCEMLQCKKCFSYDVSAREHTSFGSYQPKAVVYMAPSWGGMSAPVVVTLSTKKTPHGVVNYS